MIRRKSLKETLRALIFVSFAPIICLVFPEIGFAFPKSDSLEGKIFFLYPSIFGVQKNEVVLFEKYLFTSNHTAKILKEVVGLPGDEILVNENRMWVGHTEIGEVLPKTRQGQKLSLNQGNHVPKGHLFVRGTHQFSFDSRYEEFGFIPMKTIQKKAIRLW